MFLLLSRQEIRQGPPRLQRHLSACAAPPPLLPRPNKLASRALEEARLKCVVHQMLSLIAFLHLSKQEIHRTQRHLPALAALQLLLPTPSQLTASRGPSQAQRHLPIRNSTTHLPTRSSTTHHFPRAALQHEPEDELQSCTSRKMSCRAARAGR